MYTAADANLNDEQELDDRIRAAVKESDRGYKKASMRVYVEDWFCSRIQYELERRGFINVYVPSITLKGDVEFEWE